MNKNQVKVAVIGYGYLGRWHCQKVEAIAEAELVAIVDVTEEAREKATLAHPDAIIVEDLAEVIDQIDAAIIAAPTSLHFSLMQQLLKAKKHIFCEKPLCATMPEVKEIESMMSKVSPSTVLQVGHSERFHQVWEDVRSLPLLQDPQAIWRFSRLAPFHPRGKDVDVVQDLMIHDIDLMLWSLGESPQEIKAYGLKTRTSHWDVVTAEFAFPSGRRVVIESHRDYVKVVREVAITTTQGTLFIDLLNCQVLQTSHHDLDVPSATEYSKRDHLLLEQQLFYRAILKGYPPAVSFTDGVRSCHVAHDVLNCLNAKMITHL